MSWLNILGLAVGLAMDAFAVAIVVGSLRDRLTFRPMFRLSFHFGLFQFLMPVIGWYLSSRVSVHVADLDHWIAFGLLALVGGKMIQESVSKDADPEHRTDPTRKWTLIVLSVATSIDALAVGLTMGILQVEIWTPSVVIGLVACTMTAVGMGFGRRLGRRFGRRMELIGGLILIGIGIKIAVEHLLAAQAT